MAVDKERLYRQLYRIRKVEEEIARCKEETKPVAPDNAIGRLTRMEAINAKSIKEANLRSATQRLQKLKIALSKIDEAQFGVCAECGEMIAFGRLLARPESSRCVECAA